MSDVQINLDQLLVKILRKYGQKSNIGKWFLPFEDRPAAFVDLVQMVRDLGGTEEYFSERIKRRINEDFIRKTKRSTSASLRGWYEASLKDLNLAIEEVFGDSSYHKVEPERDTYEDVPREVKRPRLTIEIFKPSDVKNPMPPIQKVESVETDIEELLRLRKDDE